MALIAGEDIATRLGCGWDELTGAQQAALDLIAQEIEAEAVGELRRGLDPQTRTETFTVRPGRTSVTVNRGPITSVTSATVNGVTQPTGSYKASPNTVTFTDLGYHTEPATVVLVYVGGFGATDQDELRPVLMARALRAAVRVLDDTVAASSVSSVGGSASYEPDEWTDAELAKLRRKRRPSAAGEQAPPLDVFTGSNGW